ncbi:hypothetical protein SNEBB_005606 [Seison nebaliae]|nr:hypothetical protein SNEBB_005606 [Seison nebaliae]
MIIKRFPNYYDSLTHGMIGAIVWFSAIYLENELGWWNYRYSSTLFVACVSTLIDLDHFFAADQWTFDAATNLKERPLFHHTILTIIILSLLPIIYGIISSDYQLSINFIVMIYIGIITHHIRDGIRHGIYTIFGMKSPKINYFLSILLISTHQLLLLIYFKLVCRYNKLFSLF